MEASRVLARERVVAVGELLVSGDPAETLVTYALGSCLGVAVHDPVAGVAGLLHAMLPKRELDPGRARVQPAVFVESGVPALFRACYALGARKHRMVVRLAGAGTSREAERDQFEIGKRNLLMARQLFWRNNVLVRAADVGGSGSRTLSIAVGSGLVVVRSPNGSITL